MVEQEEIYKLEKENFDLKLRIFHLEESIRKHSPLKEDRVAEIRENQSDSSNLILTIQEKNAELEQRNNLLMKAKSAIEALKYEVDRLRKGTSSESSLQQECDNLQHKYELIAAENDHNIRALKNQIASLKDVIANREMEINIANDKRVN